MRLSTNQRTITIATFITLRGINNFVLIRHQTLPCVSDVSERQVILDAMRELSLLTCITFREVDSNYKGKPVLDFMKDYG